MENSLSVSDGFDAFLQVSLIKKEEISDVQYTVMRRAFYAGFGQLMIILRNQILVDESEAQSKILDDIDGQLIEFWMREVYNSSYSVTPPTENSNQ